MSDPRNVAHDKKVTQEKKHQAAPAVGDQPHTGQPGKKTAVATQKVDPASTAATALLADGPDDGAHNEGSGVAAPPAALEASLVVLAQLKDLDFHSRAHLERLAALQMTVEDELKQKDVAGPLADVYAAQSTFQIKLTVLIDVYKAECDRMQGAAA
jgi:hypothetical protein